MFGIADKLLSVIEEIIKWSFDSIKEPFKDLPTLKNLVFGKVNEENLVWASFLPDELTNGLAPLYYTTVVLAGFVLVALIVNSGIRIAGAPLNPARRNETIEFIKDLLFVGIVLVNLPTVYDLLFTINKAIVGIFNGAYESNIDDLREQQLADASGVLGFILAQLVLLGLAIWANFYYLMRKVTLIILMGMGPLMLAFWLHPKFKLMTGAWFRELVGTIFVQAIHAFVFWTVAVISTTSSGFIESVIVYVIFIPISESIRRMLNMGGEMQGGLSKAGAMFGMAGLAGMYGSIKGAMGDKSVMSTLRGAYQGVKNSKDSMGRSTDESGGLGKEFKKTIGAGAGNDIGTTTKADKMLRAGDYVGKMGKATLGMAGSIAGSGLGPVGAMGGATFGFATGGVLGGISGRMGAATIHGLGTSLQKGIAEAKNMKQQQKQSGFEDNLANEIADREIANWADGNRESQINSLRERFPDATDSEIDSKLNAIKADKRKGYYDNAVKNIQSAKKYGEGKAKGDDLVQASSKAMTNQWADENKEAFSKNYEQNHPRQEGESDEAFETRKTQAFNDKKASMQKNFANEGQRYIKMNAVDGNEPISISGFNKHMAKAVHSMDGVSPDNNIAKAGSEAVNHVQGVQMFDGAGKPNAKFLASGMANARTTQMKDAFVSKQIANGTVKEIAEQDWQINHEKDVHRANVAMYREGIDKVNSPNFSTIQPGSALGNIKNNVMNGAKISGAFLGGATGISSASRVISSATKAGFGTGVGMYDPQVGPMKNILKSVAPSMKAGWEAASTHIIESQGGVVQAQANYQNSIGYASGMLFGGVGYRKGKQIASRISPLYNDVQEEIHSPGEVIQMARTTTDEYGNKTIASGTIRQVTTPNESYIEVQTKSGERKIVSRKGSGHSGLRKGDVVYQDLTVDGDQLVAASTSTYRIDSAGGRASSSIRIESQPSTLLGDAQTKAHRLVNHKNVPVYSQLVENGQFYTNDLVAQGFENAEVVIEKDRQFVTAQKEGITYRVSPVFAGDSRLSSTESIQIPVEVKNNRLEPNYIANSTVAVQANISGPTIQETIPYYSTKSVHGLIDQASIEELIPSKHHSRAQRSVSQRKALDAVRRKQGLLG